MFFSKRLCTIAAVMLLIAPTSLLFAQELDATVEVNVTALPEQERLTWASFKQDMFTYVNNYNWTTSFSGERIHCSFQFNIVNTNGSDYTVQLFVNSTRPLYKSDQVTTMARFFDDQLKFSYVRGQVMQHGGNYRELESVIDFYAYVILGLDYDSYQQQNGTPFFQQAQQVAVIANGSRGEGWDRKISATGTYSRLGYIEDVLNANNRAFRDVTWRYHYDGLDLLSTKPEVAKDNIAAVLDTLVLLKKGGTNFGRSQYMRSFFEAKYPEIAELGRYFPSNLQLYFSKLYFLDPLHQNYYEETKSRIGS